MRKLLHAFCLSFLFHLFPVLSSIQISEVMPHFNNPLGCEWVELYNPSNLTIFFNGTIGDNKTKNNINFTFLPYSFLLILEEECNISAINLSLKNTTYVHLSSEINYRGLNDKKDCVLLNSSKTKDSFCWNHSIEGKGYSFCRINNTWYGNCTPTPGKENKLPITPKVIDILEKPYNLSFGSLGFIKGFLYKKGIENLFNKNISKIRLLVYSPGGQGSYIVRNFDDSVIYSRKGCNSNFAITLSNLTNKTYFSIPFFITKNCDNSKKEGIYKIRIRIFDFENGTCPDSDGKSKYYDIAELQIKIEGINKNLCPKEKIIYKTKKSKKKKKENKNIIITIENQTIEYPYIFSEITITNNKKKEVSGFLYSYLFKGRICFTKGWKENQIYISLPPRTSKKIELKNIISKNTKTGIYKFRVRFSTKNKKYDSTKEIYLFIPEKVSEKKEKKNPKIPNFTVRKGVNNFFVDIKNCLYCKIFGVFNNSNIALYFYSNNTLYKKDNITFSIPNKKLTICKQANKTEEIKIERKTISSSKIAVPNIISSIHSLLSFFEYLIKSSIKNI